ncbi:hypothetical protein AAG596_15710 [Citromicrobium bathyomarinum]|uniref:hypothetical protein n=1 Tax=Citromicrobium bathyomarinum TaxID=72174 RepID=UPI00315A3B1F
MADNTRFIADVSAWADRTAEQMLRVAKQSLQDTIRDAQTPVAQGGDLPVDTGYLRNSLITETKGGTLEGADSYVLGLSSLELGDPFQVAWVADYAIPRHYTVGAGQGGGMWRDRAAQRWQQTVQRNASKVK